MSVTTQVADYPTVETAFDLLLGEEEITDRTCRLYLLNVNQTGDVLDRKFYNVNGTIIDESEESVTLEIDLANCNTL